MYGIIVIVRVSLDNISVTLLYSKISYNYRKDMLFSNQFLDIVLGKTKNRV